MSKPIMIKSFRAKDLSEALRKIRVELGPDAIILETKHKRSSRFSWSNNHVEVTASNGPTSEKSPLESSQEEQSPTIGPIVADTGSIHPQITDSVSNAFSYPLCFVQVGSELLMRDLPRERVESWLDEALATLGSETIDPWVVRACLAQLLRREIVVDSPTSSWTQRRSTIAIVGPPGHGKSSVVAKLASIVSMHLELRPLVISCLHPSTPPQSRLADYCELMGWSYEQVDAPKLASTIATRIDHNDWIVLDIPSIRLGDVDTMEMWRATLSELDIAQTHLTVSATTATPHAMRWLDWYQAISPSHLLITHLDEALGLGGFYPFLCAARLPLGFATFGPDIPNDVVECDNALLAQWILGCES